MTGRPGPDRGSATVAVLALLVLIAAMAAAGAAVHRASLAVVRRSERAAARWRELRREVDGVIAALAADPTPAADSPLDPGWEAVAAACARGFTVVLEDASSGLNPNWAAVSLLDGPSFAGLVASPLAAAALGTRREDMGFSPDPVATWGDLFADGVLEEAGTAFGYANVNVADERSLWRLYLLRTGDPPGAELFLATLRQRRRERRVVQPDELRAVLGAGCDALSGVVTAEPQLNVHYLAPVLLEAILAAAGLGVPRPAEAAGAILAARAWSELSAGDLARLAGAPAGSPVYQYLGVRTWFWRITASRDGARLEVVVARVPSAGGGPGTLEVVEERRTAS